MSSDENSVLQAVTTVSDPRLLWSRLFPLVDEMVRVALRFPREGRLHPDREDLVAESAYAALRNITRYRSGFHGGCEREARAWLWAVCRNAARREAGRQGRRLRPLVVTDPVALALTIDRAVRHRPEDGADLRDPDLLARLIPNPVWRRIWLLHNRPGEALSCEEIAAVTGYRPGSVEVLLSRARALIRSGMEPVRVRCSTRSAIEPARARP